MVSYCSAIKCSFLGMKVYICRDRTSNSTEFQILSTELPIGSSVDRTSNLKFCRQNFKFCWQNLKFCQYFWSELPIGSSVDRTSNPISSLRAISHSSSFQFSYCFSFVFLTTYYCWSLTFKFILEELYTMTQWLL